MAVPAHRAGLELAQVQRQLELFLDCRSRKLRDRQHREHTKKKKKKNTIRTARPTPGILALFGDSRPSLSHIRRMGRSYWRAQL
eukprot:4007784-Prymnesium_polylepis.1